MAPYAATPTPGAREVTPSPADSLAPEGMVTGAPVSARAGRWRRMARTLLLSMAFAGLCSAGAWHLSGRFFAKGTRSDVAERWWDFRRCVLGPALAPGERPTARLHALHLGMSDEESERSAWPHWCLPYASALDRSLSVHSMHQQLGLTAPATQALQESGYDRRVAAIEQLFASLEDVDLPIVPSSTDIPPVPFEPAAASFDARKLEPFTRVGKLSELVLASDPGSGSRLRILDVRSRKLCLLAEGRTDRWQSIECREVAEVGLKRLRTLRLAGAEPETADMLYARDIENNDGFYDASSGQRLWRPQDPHAEAYVQQSGMSTILYRERKELDGGRRMYRLVRFRPGYGPSNQRLPDIAVGAVATLLPRTLLWWTGAGKAYAHAVLEGDAAVGTRQLVGDLPARSRLVDSCSSTQSQALLFENRAEPPELSLVFHRRGLVLPPVKVGPKTGEVQLDCDGERAWVMQTEPDAVRLRRCGSDGCEPGEAVTPPYGEATRVSAKALVAGKLVMVWAPPAGEPERPPRGALRLRAAPVGGFAGTRDTVLVDELDPTLRPVEMRLFARNGLGLLLLRDRGGRVSALTVNEYGKVDAVKASSDADLP